MTDTELYEALLQPTPTFALEALTQAMADPDTASRVSRRVLSEALDAVRSDRPDDLEFAPVYSLFLIGYHRDRGALDLLSEIAKLSSEQNDQVLGDARTEGLSGVLWSTCGGDAAQLLAIVDDPKTETYWKSSALGAILIGVAEGALDRHDMLREFRCRLENELSAQRPQHTYVSDTPTWLVDALSDLGDEEDIPLLDRAYDEGLVDGIFIGPETWRRTLDAADDERMQNLRRRARRQYPVDPLGLQDWECFDISPQSAHNVATEAAKAKAKARAKARAKAKAQKKARKRNRRRQSSERLQGKRPAHRE